MIVLKNAEEIELMRLSAQVVSKTLGEIAKIVRPGISPLELDKIAEECILDQGAKPGFKGMYDYKYTLCTSVNEQVVHGIPTSRPLEEGDIISVDCGSIMNGFYGDHAYTFCVGEVSPEVRQLIEVTKESLYRGIEAAKAGNRTGDIGNAVQSYTESFGYGVVEN